MRLLSRLIVGIHLISSSLVAFAADNTSSAILDFSVKPSMFGAGEVILPCEIGQKAFDCKLDTGANLSSIWTSHILESSPVLAKVKYSTASGLATQCDIVKADLVKIGAIEKSEMEIVRCPAVVETEQPKVILGLDWLSEMSLYLDYQQSKLTLQPSIPGLDLTGAMKYTTDSVGHVLLPIELKSGGSLASSVAFWDTGAALTLVSKEFVALHPELFTLLKTNVIGQDSLGKELTSELLLAGILQIGGKKIPAPYVMAIDFKAIKAQAGEQVDFILGHNVTHEMNWKIDFLNKTWSVE